jgi:phospholipid N-methyltransferase
LKVAKIDILSYRLYRQLSIRELKSTILDKFIFLSKFIKYPKSIGSLTPSSKFLAQAMIKPIDWESARLIVELGAGTGIFTRYIEQLKHPHCKGIIFEQDEEMAKRLMKLYRGFYYYSRAEELYSVMQKPGLYEADYILSGLPFANLTQSMRDRILDGVVRSLKPGGLFIQFQYSLQMKNKLYERFTKIDLEFVPLNIPPAFIYFCHK